MTDDEIDAVYDSVPWKDLNVAALEHVSVLRRRFARAIRNAVLEEVAQRFDATGRDLAAADVRALKTKEGE